MRTFRGSVAVLAVAASGHTAVQAQIVRGRVIDAQNAEPIPQVQVEAFDAHGGLIRSVLTDQDGRFDIPVNRLGAVRLALTRLGYTSEDTLNVATSPSSDLFLALTLHPKAVELEGFTITGVARPQSAKMRTFYRRMDRGQGDFIEVTPDDRIRATQPTDLFRGLAGIQIPPQGPPVFMRGVSIGTRGGACRPLLYVDGALIPWAADERLESIVSVQAIEAIEIYKGPATIPIEWRTSNGCGAIGIWTR